jgi:plasmid stability protein
MEDGMATLNIKNLPKALHHKLRERAKRQRRSLSQEATQILSDALDAGEPVSILALRGLGKERWARVDAVKHVAEERRGWD